MNFGLKIGLIFLAISTSENNAAISFANTTSTFTLSGANASLSVDTPMTGFNGVLNVTNKTNSSITKTAAGNTIAFANGGSIMFNNAAAGGNSITNYTFDGVLDSVIGGGTNTLTLAGTNTINANFGTIGEAFAISGTGNCINGMVSLNNAIALTNAGTSLSIGLEGKLNQSITLNGGTLTLTKDLALKDGVFILGTGTIDVGNYSLKLPYEGASVWSSAITWQNANDVTISRYTTLNSTWNFNGGTNNLNGGGSILDLSGGGTLNVGAGATLNIIGVHIKGLGSGGGNITINATGNVNLVNTTLELVGNYALSAGTMTVVGANCRLIAPNGFVINVTNSGTSFRVNQTQLRYNALDGVNAVPIVATAPALLTLLNGGSIMADYIGATTGINYGLATGSGNNITNTSLQLNSGTTMNFTNATPASPKAMTFDGQGNYLDFTNSTGTPLKLAANVTLTMQNVIIHNFNPSQISYGGAGPTLAKIVFGNNVSLYYNQDTVFDSYANVIFNGSNGVIDGGGATLSVNASQIQQTGAGNTLTIRNAKIKCEAVNSIVCGTATSTINLQNVTLAMTSLGFTWSTGHLNITDNVTILGSNASSSSGTSVFTFASKGLMTVTTNSTLNITKYTTFTYNPDITSDAGVIATQKRHFVMADTSSTLNLDNCTISTGTIGLALDHGNLYVNGATTFNITTSANAQLDLGSNCIVTVAPGANLIALGPIKYTAST